MNMCQSSEDKLIRAGQTVEFLVRPLACGQGFLQLNH